VIEKLRGLAINDVPNEIVTLPDQPESPLYLPESEIINRWLILTSGVSNLALSFCHGSRQEDIQAWARSHAGELEKLSAFPVTLASEHIIEATVWNVLLAHIFDASAIFGKACWAGRYAGELSKLGSSDVTIHTGLFV